MTAGRTLNTLSQEWGTPEKYVNAVRDFFGGSIDLDPCSNEYSIVNARTEYRLPKHDGLRESWNFPSIYVNPPYGIDKEHGTSIKKWLCRCAAAYKEYKSEVLALVPVATNTGTGRTMSLVWQQVCASSMTHGLNSLSMVKMAERALLCPVQ